MRALRLFLAVCGLLYFCIFVHEAGHFVLFKAQNVGVDTFKIGIGPTLLRYEGVETDYELGLIPIGGYNRPTTRLWLETYTDHQLEELRQSRPARHAMLTDESRFVEKASRVGNIITMVSGVLVNFVCAWLGMFLLVYRRSSETDGILGAASASTRATARQVKIDALNIFTAGRSKLGRQTIPATLKELLPNLRYDAGRRRWMVAFVSLSIVLGFFNILPIPPLDGGKALLELIQIFTGELNEIALAAVNLAGFLFIIGFVLYYHLAPSGGDDDMGLGDEREGEESKEPKRS